MVRRDPRRDPHIVTTRCRWIADAAGGGAWNMAVDEWLLDWAQQGARPALRIYQWDQPTLSLGYFQSIVDRREHPPSSACDCVRRHSGGGAILHHHELTYSMVLPVADRWSKTAEQLYTRVHEGLASLIRNWGAECSLYDQTESAQAFLCFERRATGDLVSGPHKITGSAQRRQRGALLQHGSLLLLRSPSAPSLPGVFDLAGKSRPLSEARQQVARAVAEALDWELVEEPLTPDEQDQAKRFVERKFGQPSWTHRR